MNIQWKLVVGGLWKPILAVLGALGLYAKGRSDAKAKARADQAEATVEALHRANEGRNEAVADLRKGKTPTEIKAKNDKAWGKTSAKSAEAIRSASQARKAALERLAKR